MADILVHIEGLYNHTRGYSYLDGVSSKALKRSRR